MTDSHIISSRQADDFAAAMLREIGVSAARKPEPRRTAPGVIDLGAADDTGDAIGLSLEKLLDGRLLVQGVSGAGKSWTLRRLLEQSAGEIAQIVVDPEGEFSGLFEQRGWLTLDGAMLDRASVAAVAARLREHRISARLDLSQVDRETQLRLFSAFVRALVDAPREYWTPALVAIDEAHLFAPYGAGQEGSALRRESIAALVDLMSRGRKRGLGAIIATQRLARMAKSVVSEALNVLVGLNTLDLDIRRAAETIGWDARRAFDRLPMLAPGEFVAVGPAFSRSPVVVKVGRVTSPHLGARPAMAAPVKMRPDEAAALIGLDELAAQSRADAETREPPNHGARALRAFLRDPDAALATRVVELLRPIAPDGARLADLAKACDATSERISGALALLDTVGVLEVSGDGETRAVRLTRGMR